MTWKKLFLSLFIMAVIATSIGVFGPMFSKKMFENYRKKIDKKATSGRAALTGKNSHKGNSVYFRYEYKGKTFTNSEANEYCYDKAEVGDSIDIRLDSVSPGNSYIIGK